ncbi:hypothetical protein [Bacillus atrophaeus]|uniref:hypothetical protein n=1 Tax=Bacillus atrophaeus TaxID=1452 RepID=UPI002282ECFA|nr:hypothetical protein [Bacillus atrophaeus]MCY8958264.1 hypothetical protein [Bacillus atrophaeus]MCY8963837.1 hypothetical protein [Bacillus atrophaeus]MCY9440143.1 hypothetical protein [Bacillus atrophaeus]MEC0648422.1 hypothetical protein [Bacillus atrophaeus]
MELSKKITTPRGTYEIKLFVEEGKILGWNVLEWEVKDLITKSTLAAGNEVPGLIMHSDLRKWSLIEQVKKIIGKVEAGEMRKKKKSEDIKEFNEWSGVFKA